MAQRKIQLLSVAEAEYQAHPLAHRHCKEIVDFPADVGISDGAEPLFRLEEQERGVRVVALAGQTLQLADGESLEGTASLVVAPGQQWLCGGYRFRFSYCLEKVQLSFWGVALSRFAKTMAVLFFVVEVWMMFLLFPTLVHSDIWESSSTKLHIVRKMDALNRRLKEWKGRNVLESSLIDALRLDLSQRIAYMKQYDGRMRRSQRRRMYEDCLRMERILDALEKKADFGEPLPLDYDMAIRKVLGAAAARR